MMSGQDPTSRLDGVCAILGVDIVAYSTLADEDQLQAVKMLLKCIRSSLDYHTVGKDEYHWSPAGDGGFLTLAAGNDAANKGIDIAFSILDRIKHRTWMPRTGKAIELRLALHSGKVQESAEFGGGTNIWGDGINMAARVLAVSAGSQVLASVQYFDTFIRNKRETEFLFGEPVRRTVKHGVRVEVRNVTRGELGLSQIQEESSRWHSIGSIWRRTVESYMHLVDDALAGDAPIAALAATKFLMELNRNSKEVDEKVQEVFFAIGEAAAHPGRAALRHPMFNVMPPYLLKKLIQDAVPVLVNNGDIIYREGEEACSCFFLVYGRLRVEGSQFRNPIELLPGEINGEFALWIPDSRRTGTVIATDACLLLEISHSLFKQLSEQSNQMAERVHAIIKRRLLELLFLQSTNFFPDLDLADAERLMGQQALVEKHPAGSCLDLRQRAYILFHGKLRMQPPTLEGQDYEIEADGRFARDKIAGIKATIDTPDPEMEAPDGHSAEVIKESVTVSIPHKAILEISHKNATVEEAWDIIWGKRMAKLGRERRTVRRS